MAWEDDKSNSVGLSQNNPTTPEGSSSHSYPGTQQTSARYHSPHLRDETWHIRDSLSMQKQAGGISQGQKGSVIGFTLDASKFDPY